MDQTKTEKIQFVSENDRLVMHMETYPTSTFQRGKETGRFSPVVDHWRNSPDPLTEHIWDNQRRLETIPYSRRYLENAPSDVDFLFEDLIHADSNKPISSENETMDMFGFKNDLARLPREINADWLTPETTSKIFQLEHLQDRNKMDFDLQNIARRQIEKSQNSNTAPSSLSGFDSLIKIWDVDAWKLIDNV